MTENEHEDAPVGKTSKTKANKKIIKKQDAPQKRQIVTEEPETRINKTASKIVKKERRASIKDRNKQGEISRLTADIDEDLDGVGHVESFARICQVCSSYFLPGE